jgi:hypothetical protein
VLRHLGADGLRVMLGQMSQLRNLPPGWPAELPEGETAARSG